MTEIQIWELVSAQRAYFETGATLDVKTRTAALKALKRAILARSRRSTGPSGRTWGKANLKAICARWEWSWRSCPT